jgi:type I restriction enzyme, S subunit
MADWKVYKIKDAPFEIIDGDRGQNYPTQNEFYSNGHCLFLSAKNVKKTGFDFSERQFISEEKDNLLRKGKLKRNDTVLTTRGTVGNLAFYSNQVPFENIRINSGMIIVRPFENELKPKFCFYLFRALQQNHFEVFASGSAQPQLPIRDLNEIEISIPEPDKQQAIAEVLSSLDDKIDLLHRQNRTLEALAETLFRQRFVEGAEENWEVGKLGEVFEVGIGRTPPRKEQHWFSTNPTDIKWISIKDMGLCSVYIDSVAEYLTAEAVEKFNVPIIPEDTVLLSFKMTLGRLVITTEEMLSNEAIAHFKKKAHSPLFPEYLYLFLKTFKFETLGSTSSIVEAINSQMIKEIEMPVPDVVSLREFKELIEPHFSKIKKNSIQIRTLTKLRDTLLPKLMSGEVRVKIDEVETATAE